MNHQIILASSSPRRQLLLKEIGIKFKAFSSQINESVKKNEKPETFALRIAKEKALKASSKAHGIIISADTIIKIDGKIIGKPKNKKDALQILSRLNGRRHAVITGLAVYNTHSKKIYTKCVKTYVFMDSLTSRQIRNYVETGEPLDKAGAYGIQGKGKFLIKKIEGCYFNVVGLPVFELSKLLKKAGVEI